MRNWHWLQFAAHGILAFFIGIMAYVAWTAYSRPSGYTGVDMADVQQMRHDAKVWQHPSMCAQK